MKKNYILLAIACCIFQLSNKVFAADDPVELQYFDLTGKVMNQGFELPDQVYSVRSNGLKGIEGWSAGSSVGFDTVMVDETSTNVLEGIRSLKVITKGMTNTGLQGYSASVLSDTIPVDTLGRYTLSFWTKAEAINNSAAYWVTLEAYDMNGIKLSDQIIDSQWGGIQWIASHTRWERVLVPMNIANTAIKYVKLVVQCNYTKNTFWFDNVRFQRLNPKPQQNMLLDFNDGQLPLNLSNQFIGLPTIDNSSKSVYYTIPDPEVPGAWSSNLGWGQQIILSTNLKPVTPVNWILRFRVRFAGGPANLFAWDGGTKKKTPQTDANRGFYGMQCNLFKAGNVSLGNAIANINVVDNNWINVQVDLTSAAANLVGDEKIEKITMSTGISGKLYYGDLFIDDIRFGFPPMVKLSSISKTELAAGWELKVNPTRDCKLYMVPQGTELTEAKMEETVTAGTGFRFDNLVGAFDNIIPTSNLNATANPKNYIAVAYRNAEDLSSGDLITVYPPHNTAKYTAYHVSSFPGEVSPIGDGSNEDPIWKKVPETGKIEIVNETALRPYNSAEYKATFKAVYDNENMYFLVEAEEPKDSLVNFDVQPGDPATEVKPWLCDAVEFLFRNDSESKGYNQVLLGHGKSIFEGQSILINNMTYIDQNTMGNIPTGNKYFFEVIFPLNEIGFTTTPAEGSILYAELGVFNNNRGYKLPNNYKLVWDGPVFQKVSKPGGLHWGEITLTRNLAPNAVKNPTTLELSVSPNPAVNTLKINADNIINSIQIYNLAGVSLKKINNVGNMQTSIDISELQSGSYLIKVVAGSQVYNTKFIKK